MVASLVLSCAAMALSTTPVQLGPARPATAVVGDHDGADRFDNPARAVPIGVPDMPVAHADATGPLRPQTSKTLFINFDGADMQGCGFNNNDPKRNCSRIFQGTVLPFHGDAGLRAAMIQAVRSRMSDFGVRVTDQRPPDSVDYDMEMVGNWEGMDPEFAGVAPGYDCFDNNGGETSFTLGKWATTSDSGAEVILQELAHSWGLDHVGDNRDLLFPTTEGRGKMFIDECLTIVRDENLEPGGVNCPSQRQQGGCSGNQQNSHAELLQLFGGPVLDTSPPTLAILAPAPGEAFNLTGIDPPTIDLTLSVADDQQPAIIATTITLNADTLDEPVVQNTSLASPLEADFPITLPDGNYTVDVDIEDESGNVASASVNFSVTGSSATELPGGSGGDAGDGGDATEGGADDGGTDSGADDGGGPGGSGPVSAGAPGTPIEDDGGCGCHTSPSAPGPGPALTAGLFCLAGLVRRRRRDAML